MRTARGLVVVHASLAAIAAACSLHSGSGGDPDQVLHPEAGAPIDATVEASVTADTGPNPTPDAAPAGRAGSGDDASPPPADGGGGGGPIGDAAGGGGSDATADAGVPSVGCSDGVRDAFTSLLLFPTVAGCKAAYAQHSLRDPKTGTKCGNDVGKACPVPADACDVNWHLCGTPPYGPTDVSSRLTAAQCNEEPGGEYAIALGDQSCEPCGPGGGSGAACCGANCIQQNGSCIYPNATKWVGMISGRPNLCGQIQNDFPGSNGVLCCKD